MESINPVDNPMEVPRHSMKAQDSQPERREDPKLAVEVKGLEPSASTLRT